MTDEPPAAHLRADEPPAAHLRADARRNRQRLLDAAVEVFVEQGADAPLDLIARRAGVGIATLYRRFPDRDALVDAVALQAFAAVRELAETATGPEGGHLEAFLFGVADLGVGALMTSLLPALQTMGERPTLDRAFLALVGAVDELVARAHRTGELRPEVTSSDVMLLLAATTRPLEGLPATEARAMARRLLAIAVRGLAPPSGPAPTAHTPPLDLASLRRAAGRGAPGQLRAQAPTPRGR